MVVNNLFSVTHATVANLDSIYYDRRFYFSKVVVFREVTCIQLTKVGAQKRKSVRDNTVGIMGRKSLALID